MILFKSNRVTDLLDDSSPFDALLAGQRRFRQVATSLLFPETYPLTAHNPIHSRTP